MTQEDKKIITNELNRRLKQLWLSSSAQDDNDGYYRNPLVKQLKELAVFVSNIKESEKPFKVGDKVIIPNGQNGIITRISAGKARVEMGDTMRIVDLSDLKKRDD